MAEFRYTAKGMDGKVVKGKIKAADERGFFAELEKKKLICISHQRLDEDKGNDIFQRLKTKELASFCRELGVLLDAGIPVIRSLQTLQKRAVNKRLKKCYMSLIEYIGKGESMADAMTRLGGTFPPILISMIRIGEQGGALSHVVVTMAEYYAKEHKSKSKMQTMMIYPMLLLAMTIVVVIALFTFVLPRFFQIFEGTELPLITRIFMAISNFLVNDWKWLLLIVAIVVFAVVLIGQTRTGRYMYDKWKCKMPVVGKLTDKGRISRFANTMYVLTNSGIVVLESLKICASSMGNVYVKEKFDRIREEVEKGRNLSDCMESEGLFENMVWSMVATGEETGNPTLMYQKLYEYYEQEADIANQKLLAILEPVIMLVIGVLIGLVMASVLIPIYNIYK